MLAVQNQDYFFVGMLCVLSIIYGGSGFPFISQQIFDYIVHGSYNVTSIEPTNKPDYELRCLTEKIKDATSNEELQAVLSDEISMLTDTGYRKPIANVTVSDKSELLSVITDFQLMAKCKMELDQFCEGLKVFEFLDVLKINPSLWKFRVLSLGVSPKVKFREGQLATSSTCAMEIHLLLDHPHYISFKEAMVLAIKGNNGFGKC